MSIARSPWVALALALTIFVTGVGAGIAVDRLWLSQDRTERTGRRGGPPPERLLAKFQKRLDLTAEQAAAIGKILEEVDAEMHALHAELGPARAKIRERTRARILELLTPEQAAEYERIIAQEDQRKGKRKGKHRRPGPDRAPGH